MFSVQVFILFFLTIFFIYSRPSSSERSLAGKAENLPAVGGIEEPKVMAENDPDPSQAKNSANSARTENSAESAPPAIDIKMAENSGNSESGKAESVELPRNASAARILEFGSMDDLSEKR